MTQEPEIIKDRQRDVMAILRFMLLKRQRKNSFVLDQPGREPKILTTLNWIATCFVTEPVGDVVATAVFAEQAQIIFYIAANRGPPRDQDRKNGETFIQLLRDTIRQTDLKPIINQIMEVISPIIYPRLARKVDLIKVIDKTESLSSRERFDAIVDRWAEDGNVEDDESFLRNSTAFGFAPPSMDGNQRLKQVFDRIVSTATTLEEDTVTTRQLQVRSLTIEVCILLHTKFFKSFRPEGKNPIPCLTKDFIWISRLRRRLWRVARYYTGLSSFAKLGLSFVRHILGEGGSRRFADGGSGVKIVWVGDQPGVLPDNHDREVEMTLRPIEFLNKLFDQFDYMAESEEKLPAIPPESLKNIENLWANQVKPFVHCELQMILYLQANNIRTHDNAIGNSKLMCWACNAYVKKANKERGDNAWLLSGTSEKPNYRWLIPSGALGDAVVSDIMEGLKSLVSQFAVEFGRHQRQLSGGSDSSSDESVLLELELFIDE